MCSFPYLRNLFLLFLIPIRAKKIQPQYAVFRSYLGALLTILCGVLLLVWVVVTIRESTRGPASVIEFTVPADTNIPVNASNLMRFGVRVSTDRFGGDGTNLLARPDILGLHVAVRERQNGRVTSSVSLQPIACEFSSSQGIQSDQSIVCFRPPENLAGTYEESSFPSPHVHRYIKLLLYACSNTSIPDFCENLSACQERRRQAANITDSSGSCAEPLVITQHLSFSEIHLFMEFYDPMQKHWVLESTRHRYRRNILQTADVILQKRLVVEKQTILESADIIESESVALSFDKTVQYDSDDTGTDSSFLELFLRLANTNRVVEQDSISVLELFAQWGGLAHFLGLTVGSVAILANTLWVKHMLEKRKPLEPSELTYDRYGDVIDTAAVPKSNDNVEAGTIEMNDLA